MLVVQEPADQPGAAPKQARNPDDGGIRPSRGECLEPLERAVEVAIGAAVASGHLSFGVLDAIFPNPPALGAKTLREAAAELEFSLETVTRLYAMWGLAPPAPDEAIREHDAAVFAELAALPPKSYPQDVLLLSGRPVGEMAHRIADLAFDFFHANVEAPLLASGMSPQQIMDSTGALVRIATAAL